MIPELRDLSYESRLLQCGLTTLETRGCMHGPGLTSYAIA